MSLGYLLQEVVDALQTEFSVDDAEIDIMPDDRPKPMMGTRFISVSGSTWSVATPTNASLPKAEYGFNVAVTLRTSPYGQDKKRLSYVDNTINLEKTLWTIIDTLHPGHAIIAAAQTSVTNDASYAGTYTQIIKFAGADASPRLVGPEWFGSDEDDYRAGQVDGSAGLVMVARFNGVNFIHG